MPITLIFYHLNQHKKHCFFNQPLLELNPISHIREGERRVVIHNHVFAVLNPRPSKLEWLECHQLGKDVF